VEWRVSQEHRETGIAQRVRISLPLEEESMGWSAEMSGQWPGKVDLAQAKSGLGKLQRRRVQRVVRGF